MYSPISLNSGTNIRNLINNSRRQLRFDDAILKYPREIDEIPHKVLFKFTKRGIRQSSNTQRATNTTGMYLVLPVPSKIVDGVSLDISGSNLGLTGELIAGSANYISGLNFSSIESTGASARALGGSMMDLFNNTSTQQGAGFASELGSAGVQYFGGRLINSALGFLGVQNPAAQEALAVGLGRVLNPFTTAVFNGVKLRSFQFNWSFSPIGEQESIDLEKIIKRLRAKSLPTVSTNNLFMEFPHEVEFQYLGMQNDTFTFPTAPCYITNLEINRSPTGTPVFFAKTGAPAFVTINMSLMEIRPLVARGDENDNVDTNSTFVSNTVRETLQAGVELRQTGAGGVGGQA